MESRDWEFPFDLRGVVPLIVKTCSIIKLQLLVIMLKYAKGTLEHEIKVSRLGMRSASLVYFEQLATKVKMLLENNLLQRETLKVLNLFTLFVLVA